MANHCLEFPYGAIRHFPAGSYYDQVANWMGAAELELIQQAHVAWYAFKHLSYGDWKEPQTRLIGWLTAPPPPLPPTRRLDALIAHIWRMSPWTLRVMEHMRTAA
jgi:hypothetical protein